MGKSAHKTLATRLTAKHALVAHVLKGTPSMHASQLLEGTSGEEMACAVFPTTEHVQDMIHFVGVVVLRHSDMSRQTCVAELLSASPSVVVNEGETLAHIWNRMDADSLEVVAVSGSNERFVGAITRRSLVDALFHHKQRLNGQVAQQQQDLKLLSQKLTNTGEMYRKLLRLMSHTSIEDELLQTGIEVLAGLLHARYGAVMLLGPEGEPVRFLVSGLTPQEMEAVGDIPEGRGLLGIALGADDVLRVDDIARDPRSSGFPPHHPPMQSVVMASIVNEGTVYGRLYLADKIDGQPFSEEDGHLAQCFGCSLALIAAYARMVAERKIAEEATAFLEAQLRQTRKLEALGRLAGGVAHDFNNLLTAIMGYGELTLVATKTDERIRHNIEEILQAARRGGNLVNQLLAFGGKQVGERVVVSLTELLSGLSLMIGRLIGEDIQVILRADADAGNLLIDPGQMEQIILNLVVNARDAMSGGGTLTLETSRVEWEAGEKLQLGNLSPGPHVMFAVTDTGCGMSSDLCSRIFEPFFTTKEQGKGTGLGLSTVYGIITQNVGALAVESVVGSGTTFRVYFPRVRGISSEPVEAALSSGAIEGTETVLVVEDEPEVRTLICANLRILGYTVIDAANGAEALVLARQFADAIHLLLTDMIMPHLGGPALAELLTGLHPEMKVLYISGYMNEQQAQEEASSGSMFLQKPFTQEELGRKVREALQEGFADQGFGLLKG